MMKKLFACFSILCACFSSSVQAGGIIYVGTQETDDLQELYYSNISGSGANITASSPVKISAPQPPGGGVVYALPNFGNPAQVLYGANQDDPNKMELYIVELTTPGTSTKINAALMADQEIEAGVPCADGTKVFYTLKTISTGTIDLYVVTISSPTVATKLNPDLVDEREVGEFVITPDCTKVIYAAQLNSDAEELFVTELSNPGIATKADGTPVPADQTILQLSLSVDGSKAFWVSGRSLIGQDHDLLTVALNDLGNPIQVSETFVTGGQVIDYDVSVDATTVVYRGQDNAAPLAASNVFVVDLATAPGTADQVNPDWAPAGMLPFFGLETVTFLDNGAVALYSGPLDTSGVGELYETTLTTLQTSTKLNAALGTPTGGFPGVSLFLASRDNSLVMYSDGIGGTSGINVVNRNTPGSAVQPFTPGQGQVLGFAATFNPDSDLIGSIIANVDGQGVPVSSELYVADPTVSATNIRVNTDLAAGFGVLLYFWLPNGAPGVPGGDPDGDGIPNATDPDDDNDGIADEFDTEPLTANNFCSGGDPQNVTFQQIVNGDLSCAAEVSISVVPTTMVLAPGDLRLIAPTVTFQSGFSVAGGLTVISSHPCPACSP